MSDVIRQQKLGALQELEEANERINTAFREHSKSLAVEGFALDKDIIEVDIKAIKYHAEEAEKLQKEYIENEKKIKELREFLGR